MSVNSTGGYGPTPQDQTGACCNANTTLEVLGVAFSVFIVLFAFLMYARCLIQRSRAAQREAEQRSGTANARRKVGLDASAIASLPVFAYRRASATSGGGKAEGASAVRAATAASSPGAVECAVCLSAVEEGEMVRVLPICDHMFHAQCIDLWLSSNATCPVCRTDCDARNLAEKLKALAATPSIV